MPKDLQQWIAEGEEIYNGLLGEHRQIESQMEELEQKLADKQTDVNRLAAIIGKPPIDSSRRLSAELVNSEVVEYSNSSSMNNIARALNGRLGR